MIRIPNLSCNGSLLNIFFIYYLCLEFFISSAKWGKFSFLYFALVIPILLYILLSTQVLLKLRYNKKSIFLVLLIIIVALIAMFRIDIATIYNLILFSLPIIIIIESQATIKLSIINRLFLLVIIVGIAMYHFDLTRFGYIPYVHGVGGNEPDWKISLFPRTPASGFFSLYVIVLNYYFNKGRDRYFFYIIGFYFMLFSGLRSALLLFFVFLSLETVTKFVKFRLRKTYLIIGVLVVIGVIASISMNTIVERVNHSDNKFIQSLLAKSTFSKVQKIEGDKENYRAWLWNVHYEIYTENILFGVGTYDITNYVQKDIYGKSDFEGSESFFTRWLARIGLASILIIFFLYVVYKAGMETRNKYLYLLPIFLILIMFTYGSFLMPYNFMYFLIFGTINIKHSQ